MRPLAIDTRQFHVPGGLVGNIESALARQLPELKPAPCYNDGTFVIVGSGPSLKDFAEDLKSDRELNRPICAINGAHDWLIENGVEPDLFLTIDPRDLRHNLKLESDRTIYLLASRCSPVVFDHLKNRPILLWHALSQNEESSFFKDKGYYLIGGMSTSGLRAVNVGYHLGFRKFKFYGMDSCNAPDGITKRVDGSLTGQTIDVIVGGRKFVCNLAMGKQAEEFQILYRIMPDITIESKGDGLITAIIETRKKQGMPA